MRWPLASAVVLAALAALATTAAARSETTLAYSRDQAWPAAVRFLAVDERLKVTDKDADAGYALFELRDEGKVFRGALEVIPVVIDGRPLIRFVVAIEDRPSWLETAMLRRLERKLRLELGAPAPPPTPRPRAEPGPGDPAKDRPKDGPKDTPKDTPKDDGGPPISTTP
jgi:hypothetical protein